MRALHGALTIAALGLAAGGCTAAAPTSSGRFSGDQQAVAKVVDSLSTAAGKRDGPKTICADLLSRSLAQKVSAPGSDCPAELKKAISDAAGGVSLDVRDVTVTGTTARAQVRRGTSGPVATYTLAKDSGGWRLTSFGGR
jgi:hypothetical protein